MSDLEKKKKEIRVRFAPSPTGELHIGGLRTALTDFLFAQQNKGKFILRIEDTDQKRLVKGSIKRIIHSLEWSGIKIDEGVFLNQKGEIIQKGKFGPYIQSQRLKIYQKYVEKLLQEGKAYRCFCSAQRLEKMRKEQLAQGEAPHYDRKCLNLTQKEIDEKIQKGEKYVVRFKIPSGKTSFNDLVYGKIEVKNETLDDQVILKSDGFPTYHLASVVDDYLMKITHVFRGAEWISSTPKHILLYQALGWEKSQPYFCHMPNILNKNKRKLSKREGSVSVQDFKQQGYPAEALINFIALLGWNPKTEQEIFTLKELIEQFDIKKMNKSGGIFDLDRLNWISAQHIKRMSVEKLYGLALPFLEKKNFFQEWKEKNKFINQEEYLKKVLEVEKERLEKFTDVGEKNKFFFQESGTIKISFDEMRWKKQTNQDIQKNLKKAYNTLYNISKNNWTRANIEKELLKTAQEKRGELLFPLRAVLTGQKYSPSPFEVAWVLGKKETLSRINRALDLFKNLD